MSQTQDGSVKVKVRDSKQMKRSQFKEFSRLPTDVQLTVLDHVIDRRYTYVESYILQA